MDPLLVAKCLQYYKRRDVQEAILRHATDREVSPRYGEGFGKRPDVLSYPQDILEFAKRKATSFHVSEERWENPLQIKTGASRKEMNELRTGWDLVLDIDAKNWEVSRLTAWLFIEVLKFHGVKSISVKFSGNKGWHIGVPFEAFPKTVLNDAGQDVPTKDLFPEIPRAIASYMLDFMSRPEYGIITIDGDKVVFGWQEPSASLSAMKFTYSFSELGAMTNLSPSELLESFCPACKKAIALEQEQYFLFCHSCGHKDDAKLSKEQKDDLDDAKRVCPKCRHIMDFTILKSRSCKHDSRNYQRKFRMQEMIEIDTVLLASRHLYRMAYSLHEKSGLVSVVIDPEKVMSFKKEEADPKSVDLSRSFLDVTQTTAPDAERLLAASWRFQLEREVQANTRRATLALEEVAEAIPEEHFPPCMKIILNGLTDGKKRAMFALTNFLSTAGWSPEMIEKRLYEWNDKNATQGDPLREVTIKGHMHTLRQKKERILPPNCKSFYQELGVCKPDEFCSRIKNPGPYAIKHSRLGENPKRAKRETA